MENKPLQIKGYSIEIFKKWYKEKYNKDISSFKILHLKSSPDFHIIEDLFEYEQLKKH